MQRTTLSFDLLFRYGLCYGLILLLFLFDIQISGTFIETHLKATLSLPAIYYMAIFRPSLIPIWMLFILGLIKDLITGLPLTGLSSFILIAVFASTKFQRVFLAGQSFIMIWAGYAVVALLSVLFFWMVLCIYHLSYQPIDPHLFEGLVMALAFPLVLPVLGLTHRILPFASKHTIP